MCGLSGKRGVPSIWPAPLSGWHSLEHLRFVALALEGAEGVLSNLCVETPPSQAFGALWGWD